jgi:hypothetical protein
LIISRFFSFPFEKQLRPKQIQILCFLSIFTF